MIEINLVSKYILTCEVMLTWPKKYRAPLTKSVWPGAVKGSSNPSLN